jgi:hypothetical protein
MRSEIQAYNNNLDTIDKEICDLPATMISEFIDASIRYTSTDEVNLNDLTRWLKKSEEIQRDNNVVKRNGQNISPFQGSGLDCRMVTVGFTHG